MAEILSALLSARVVFASDCVGPVAQAVVKSLMPGEVCLLENLRFHAEEEDNDPEFARQLAAMAIYMLTMPLALPIELMPAPPASHHLLNRLWRVF